MIRASDCLVEFACCFGCHLVVDDAERKLLFSLLPAPLPVIPAGLVGAVGCLTVKMTDTRRRVKLYALNAERQWDDKGTGHVSSTYVERLKGISLLVRAESDGKDSRKQV